MALPSVIYRFKVKLSDIDRGVYETIELRLAMHPSESVSYLLTRVIAYALNLQEGLELTQGIANPDEPALQVKDLTGAWISWIEIGHPSAKRLHKASKTAKNVRVYTYRDPKDLLEEIVAEAVYQKEKIEFFSLESKFLNTLGETLERDNHWELLHNEGELSIHVKGISCQGEIRRHFL